MRRLRRVFRRRRGRLESDERDRPEPERQPEADAGSWGYLDARNAGRDWGINPERFGRPR
jgi:hypothetical protein